MPQIKSLSLPRQFRLVFWRRIKFFKFCKKNITLLFLLNFISSLFFLAGPYMSRLYIDKSFLLRDFAAFIKISLVGIVIFVGSTLANLIEEILRYKTQIKIKLRLAQRLMQKIFSLDMSFFQEQSVGENIYRISTIEAISRFVSEDIAKIAIDIARVGIILAIALFINLRLTLALVIFSPLFLLPNFYFRKKARPLYSEVWNSQARLSKRLQESFSKMQIIKILNLELWQANFYLRLFIKNIRLLVKGMRYFVAYSLSSTLLSKAVYGLLSLYGGWLIIRGELSLGSFTAVMLYLSQIGGLLNSLGYRLEYFIQQQVAWDKFFEVIERQPLIQDVAGAKALGGIKREICFRNVVFGYVQDRPVFVDLNLCFPVGRWIGIVGPSGRGKTTLANLLVRLYEVSQGGIFIDGEDIRNFKIASLRRKISIVTQQPLLFDLSLRDNICLGLSQVDDSAFLEVVSIIQAEEFVRQLPQKEATVLGEDAVCLSQGYRQRIALARGVLRNPEVLILDEATSSIDSLAEAAILKEIRKKRLGLTTIVISHRLATVKNADLVFFFAPEGNIESGTHEGLLLKCPSYGHFFKEQLEKVEVHR